METVVEKVEIPEGTDATLAEYVTSLEELVVDAADTIEKLESEVSKKKNKKEMDADMEEEEPEEEEEEIENNYGKKKMKMSKSEPEDDILKSAPVEIQNIVKQARTEAAAAQAAANEANEIAKSERDTRLNQEYLAKAESLNQLPLEVTEMAQLLKSISESSPEQYAVLENVLTAVNASLSQSDLFSEIGKSASEVGTAFDKIKAMAEERITKSESPLTMASAISSIASENPSLYLNYQEEMRGA